LYVPSASLANPEWPTADHTAERHDIIEGQFLRPGDCVIVIMASACCKNFPLDSREGGESGRVSQVRWRFAGLGAAEDHAAL
jgi:hypothetical protein